jgi:hypothetical protein
MKRTVTVATTLFAATAVAATLWIKFTLQPGLWNRPLLWPIRLHYLNFQSNRAAAHFKTALSRTKRIEFKRFGFDSKAVVVSEPGEISKIISTLSFEPAPPCMSAYSDVAAFVTDEGEITASMDDHSMMVQGNGRYGLFKAPPEFFRIYTSHVPAWKDVAK